MNAVLGLTANNTTEAIYYLATTDVHGQLLDGKKRYAITFKGPIPFAQAIPPCFWSVTMYDDVTKLTVPNPINHYSLSSDNELTKNADGSFTMYLQATSPGKDKEPNWLPAPNGPFYVLWLQLCANAGGRRSPAESECLPDAAGRAGWLIPGPRRSCLTQRRNMGSKSQWSGRP
jgi:hypothetical protein